MPAPALISLTRLSHKILSTLLSNHLPNPVLFSVPIASFQTPLISHLLPPGFL